MRILYIRWGVILLIALAIGVLSLLRYRQDVMAISPDELDRTATSGILRIMGAVQGGSLEINDPSQGAKFAIKGVEETVMVRYIGPEDDNLRELKVLVVVGQWDERLKEFQADKLAIVPNYGFITAAYLAGILPTFFFLFGMERKEKKLYDEIKQEKVYEADMFDNP